jgi:hypothetical protein
LLSSLIQTSKTGSYGDIRLHPGMRHGYVKVKPLPLFIPNYPDSEKQHPGPDNAPGNLAIDARPPINTHFALVRHLNGAMKPKGPHRAGLSACLTA